MAELLVRAKPHWMDSLTQAEVDAMKPEQKDSYNARTQIGDIIVVRPDGWQWGKEENLPNFVVIKLPNISIEQVKKYEETLSEQFTDTNGRLLTRLLKHRKYQLPKIVIEGYKFLNINLVAIKSSQVNTFISSIIQKKS